MVTKDVPLSVANIKALLKGVRELKKEMRPHSDTVSAMELQIAYQVADKVRDNIATLVGLGFRGIDGNYDGASGDAVKVSIYGDYPKVIWSGGQIFFIEFGTGAAGAATRYPGPAMGEAGYTPDPTKRGWWYNDAELGAWYSKGLPPQAPMLHAAIEARTTGILLAAAQGPIKGVLARAFNV